ncbi:hypothetical protein [Mucilaginibacter paludis]|uniref:Uncharacterized protein n=1 Tax=Mucilaginibacter paludis DSM 18603 TaxID=714943 RepID=H1YHT1_9SPHI|nr:hypothetical protein [Mucilaginibacter paludis]EHQ27481.1 hypothetical protein Mucpa_3382 [Mucilaginibacter paludis DSM 18603]
MLIVKLAILDRSFALKRWLLLQHLLRVLVGQFAPKYHGRFAPKQWVSLRRNGVVSFIIISTGHTIYTFDWMYEIEDRVAPDMWELWAVLMPVFFKHLPTLVRINTNRFIMTFQESQVENNTLIRILHAFIDWVVAHISDKGYHTSLAEIPVWFFSYKIDAITSTDRIALIHKFLSVENKVFQATFWRYVISNWKKLETSEHNVLIHELSNVSSLIKSVVLTTKDIPEELEQHILGFSLSNRSATQILIEVPEEIFIASLATLYLLPPFDDLPAKNTSLWDGVLGELLKRPDHSGFSIALTVFFDDVLLLRSTRDGMWNKPEQLFKNILKIGTSQTRANIFSKLLLDFMGTSSSRAKVYLELLISKSTQKEIEGYGEEFALNIEAIANVRNVFLIPHSISAKVERKLTFDTMLLKMLGKRWIDEWDSDTQLNFAKLSVYTLREREVKTIQGIDLLRNWARSNPGFFTEAELKIVEGYMAILQDISGEQNRAKEIAYNQKIRSMVEEY